MLSASAYYSTYAGHDKDHLEVVHEELRQQGKTRAIFLAGDSSLDNKYWFEVSSHDWRRMALLSYFSLSGHSAGREWLREYPQSTNDEKGRWLLAECRSEQAQSS
jgi:hypothetical protein